MTENKAALAVSPVAVQPVTHDLVAQRAYTIYLETGSLPGRWKRNWRQAELELAFEAKTRSHRTVSGADDAATVPQPSAAPIHNAILNKSSLKEAKVLMQSATKSQRKGGRTTPV